MCDFKAKTTDELIGSYVSIRDKKAALEKQQKEALQPFTEALAQIEQEVHARLNQAGVDRIGGSSGTAYVHMRSSVKVDDKSAFMEYVEANKEFGLLDVKANKTAIETFLETNQQLPPGISVDRTEVVGFRRS